MCAEVGTSSTDNGSSSRLSACYNKTLSRPQRCQSNIAARLVQLKSDMILELPLPSDVGDLEFVCDVGFLCESRMNILPQFSKTQLPP